MYSERDWASIRAVSMMACDTLRRIVREAQTEMDEDDASTVRLDSEQLDEIKDCLSILVKAEHLMEKHGGKGGNPGYGR